MELPVLVGAADALSVKTDLGYEIQLDDARLVVRDLEFSVAGELHRATQLAPSWQRLATWLVPSAHAHPGHAQSGDVTGELPGSFLLDFHAGDRTELGRATLIAGRYRSVNFTFARASLDEVDESDPLFGHTARFAGTASRDGAMIEFVAVIDSPEDRQLVGAPFEHTIDSGSNETLLVQLLLEDPLESDSLFDGIQFSALPQTNGRVALDGSQSEEALSQAYNRLRRTMQTHDHFRVQAVSLED